MDGDYVKFQNLISSSNLDKVDTFDITSDADQTNNKIQSVISLMNAEFDYLKRIIASLNRVFEDSENVQFRSSALSKDQISKILSGFSIIYRLHADHFENLKIGINSTKLIGKILAEFLSQAEVLEVYEKYAERIPNSLALCNIIESKSDGKVVAIKHLKCTLLSPIQRLPELCLDIQRLYKATPDDDEDKPDVYRALSLARAISALLERKRRLFEVKDVKGIMSTCTKLKLPFSSTRFVSNMSVSEIKIKFHSKEKVIKLPYYLMLYNADLVLLPRNVQLTELSTEVLFCFPLTEIQMEQKVFSMIQSANDCSISCDDFSTGRKIYFALNGSKIEDTGLKLYDELLHDLFLMRKVKNDMKGLNHRYKDLDLSSINDSMRDLEQGIKNIEKELSKQRNLIVILKSEKSRSIEDRKILLFESSREVDEWIGMFNRLKCLSNIHVKDEWEYCQNTRKGERMNSNELPVRLESFPLQFHSERALCQEVRLLIGANVSRCLWICSEEGEVIILCLVDHEWMLLDKFSITVTDTVCAICAVSEMDKDVDSEIWISHGRRVSIHCLDRRRRYELVSEMNYITNIITMCNADTVMLVTVEPNTTSFYVKDQESSWVLEREMSLENVVDNIKEVIYAYQALYVVLDRDVVIYERKRNVFDSINHFTSDRIIKTLSITSEGIWVLYDPSPDIVLYDLCLRNVLQTVTISPNILTEINQGEINCIHANDKYIWMGTDSGFIVCISSIDSLYCIDSSLPMYIHSKCAAGSITQIMAFKNVQTVKIQKSLERTFYLRSQSNCKELNSVLKSLKRTKSCPNIATCEKGHDDANKATFDFLFQNVDDVGQNTDLRMILAIGTSISDNKKSLVTFYE